MNTSPDADHESANPQSKPPHRIRGLRVMAVVRWGLLALVTLVAARTMWTFWGPQDAANPSQKENLFYCPMHPQIRSPGPGECPICHMNLEPIPDERRSESQPKAAPSAMAAAPVDVIPVSMSVEKQQAIGVASSAVVSELKGGSLRAPGVISAPETGQAQVRVRAAGFVEKVAVSQTGVRVTRGQTLAWIYSPEIYRAQEEFLAATRWNATSGATVASSAADIAAAAQRGLELLGLQTTDFEELARTGRPIRALPIRAPSSGYVTRFNAVLGFRANPETVLYELADLSTVWVVASVHERDLGSVRVGTKARFAITGMLTAPIESQVDLVEPQLDENSRTSRVRLAVRNRNFLLRPGQFGEVIFDLPAAKGIFVPRDAVIYAGEHQYVYVVSGSERFEPRIVRTGMEIEARIQVLEGLSAGDRVVTRGSFMLDSESRLQASLAAVPAAANEAGSGPSSQGAGCSAAFDHKRFPYKYTQCLACERQHAGMGSMVDDCKSAIAKPWR